jgi:DNA polymerase
MKRLGIDLETKSGENINDVGVHKYVKCPDFEILLFSYSVDGRPAVCVDLKNMEQVPKYIIDAIFDPDVKKTAFNASFEMEALGEHFSRKYGKPVQLDASQWYCTTVQCLMCGLPAKLETIGQVLNLDAKKLTGGKKLIKVFCVPQPYPKNPKPGYVHKKWILPEDAPDKWEEFKEYNIGDVDSENEIIERLSYYRPTDFERLVWQADQRINRRGVAMDRTFILNAISMYEDVKEEQTAKLLELTGLSKNTDAEMKRWLTEELETEVKTLNKKAMPDLLKKVDSVKAAEALRLRSELSLSSLSKYPAMIACMDTDDRIRHLAQYYGANRTGRWGGRRVQPQNLTRNETKALDTARRLIRGGKVNTLLALFDNVPKILSECIRTAFIASPGNKLGVSDYNSIEARIISWLSGEQWRMNVFNTHGRIYEANAAMMFKVPIESISYIDENGKTIKGPNYKLRDPGKITELALGFGGGPNALVIAGVLDKGVKESELQPLVDLYREVNPKVKASWYKFNDAAIRAIQNPGLEVKVNQGVMFVVEHDCMFIQLPSGRRLSYWQPRLHPKMIKTKAGKDFETNEISYMGMHQQSKKWISVRTYGGKLFENVVQAIARDCLAESMVISERRGIPIVLHVHDELVADIREDSNDLILLEEIMSYEIDWAPGLPLKGSAYETPYYLKD